MRYDGSASLQFDLKSNEGTSFSDQSLKLAVSAVAGLFHTTFEDLAQDPGTWSIEVKDAEALADLQKWVAGGQVKVVDDVVEGLENAPAALIGLLAGENRGKRMVRVSPDPE